MSEKIHDWLRFGDEVDILYFPSSGIVVARPQPLHLHPRPHSLFVLLIEDDFWKNDMTGSGPWKFVQWVPDQFLEITAFDGFYFGRPGIDRIIMSIIPSPDATQIAMQRDEVDVNVRGGVTVEAQETFLADPRFDVWATMGTHSGGWSFSMRQR